MKYYIATSLKRIKDHNIIRDELNLLGHEIVYDWTTHGNVKNTSINRLKEIGENMIEAIKDLDFVVVLLPGRQGTHTELGASLASKKNIFLHATDPKFFNLGEDTCAFYHHSLVTTMVCPLEEVAKKVNKELEAKTILF